MLPVLKRVSLVGLFVAAALSCWAGAQAADSPASADATASTYARIDGLETILGDLPEPDPAVTPQFSVPGPVPPE